VTRRGAAVLLAFASAAAVAVVVGLAVHSWHSRAPGADGTPPGDGLWLTGRVVDANGAPIRDAVAHVWLESEDPNEARPRAATATTDASGHWWIRTGPVRDAPPGPPPDPVAIRFVGNGYVDGLTHASLPTAVSPISRADVVLARAARIVGVVHWGTFTPVERSTVTVTHEGESSSASTGALEKDGQFECVGLPPGRYRIGFRSRWDAEMSCEVVCSGKVTPENSIALEAGQDCVIEVNLVEKVRPSKPDVERRRVICTALGLNGEPIQGASIRAFSQSHNLSSAIAIDADGRFTMYSLASEENLTLMLIVGDEIVGMAQFAGSDDNGITIREQGSRRRPAVVCRLRDKATGEPIDGAKIAWVAERDLPYDGVGFEKSEYPLPRLERTAPGTYRVPFLPWGISNFTFRIECSGYASVCPPPLDAGACVDLGPFDFELERPGSLVCRVVNDVTGEPVERAYLALREKTAESKLRSPMEHTVVVGADGTARFDDLPQATYTVYCIARPLDGFFAPEVQVERGATKTVEVRAHTGSTLTIEVFDDKGAPAHDIRIDVMRGDEPVNGWLDAVADGRCEFHTDDAGPCRVVVRGEGFGDEGISADAKILPSAKSSVTIRAKSK
jgi:hypothetical protein